MLQGSLVGAVLGLGFSLWLNFGATFSKSYEPPLPMPTFNCHLADNDTSIWSNTTQLQDTFSNVTKEYER